MDLFSFMGKVSRQSIPKYGRRRPMSAAILQLAWGGILREYKLWGNNLVEQLHRAKKGLAIPRQTY